MVTHTSIPAWRIPWTEEPGGLQSMGSQESDMAEQLSTHSTHLRFPVAQLVKNLPLMQETPVQFLGQEDPLEKGKATHSRILAWRSPWTVLSMGLQRVRYD